MNQQLNCLHRMEEILSDTDALLADICGRLLQVLPEGWRRPEDYGVRIVVEGERFDSPDFDDSNWSKTEDILTEGKVGVSVEGEEPVVLGPGDLLGEIAALDAGKRAESARAAGEVSALRLEREALLALMSEAPGLGIGLSQFLALRLRAMQLRLQSAEAKAADEGAP